MYSSQNASDFDNNKITMNQYIENWSVDQDQDSTNYQDNNLEASQNYYTPTHHTVCTPEHPVQKSELVDKNLYLGAEFQSEPFTQYNSVQYTPLTPEPMPYPVFQLPTPQQNHNIMAQKHRALITFVPTKTGNFKAIVKRKRKRTIFSRQQVEALEEIFKRKQYINREEREIIVNQLQLNDKAVKIWFQNRRLKGKKGPEQNEEEEYTVPEERNSPDTARLDYVESKINEKTDEFGYVTLDDGVMRDLFDVIDDFLTNRSVHDDAMSESSDSPIYEPISPASAPDSTDEENSSGWKPSEPNESLQRLFDLQTMLSL